MCGITGFITDQPTPASTLPRMMNAIRHRGPDESGEYVDRPAYLGHLRLSIIDLATGKQPLTNEDGNLQLIFNGEIFNHADLRPDLERAGHRYKTKSDTETIIHAYEEYGPECVTRFRGMFAFAIWDHARQSLFCVRDRLGIKPFYYYWDGRLFAFASEIKALLQHPSIPAVLEDELLPEYLAFGFNSEERTLFRGIRKLMPGHTLRLQWGSQPRLEIEQYWDVPLHQEREGEHRSDQEWIAECRSRLEETVRMRLMSDVPLGMFLSGGLDSSAIAALMKRMVSGPVKTFAVGYEEAEFSELGYSRQVASSIGTEHHEVLVGRDAFFDALPGLIWHEDEPIVWPSSVSLYFVSRLASEQVKVVLTGEGSDELFGGYTRYHHYAINRKWLKAYGIIPRPVRRGIQGMIASSSLLSASLRRKLGHTFIGRGETLESLYIDNAYSAFSGAEQGALHHMSGPVYDNFRRYCGSDSCSLGQLLYADQKTYLVELLMKQDQMSMACSIESRVPFLDHPFVEFAARVPDHLKIRGGEGKYILKKAVEDLLPHEIVYRRKMGFPTPVRAWIADLETGGLRTQLERSDGLLASYLNLPAVRSLLDDHQNGRIDATDRIWRLLNLQIWGDIFLSGRCREPWAALRGAAQVSP
jgi:asparagine synthase (glutamine-hydrolysing)